VAQANPKIRKNDFRTGIEAGFKEAWESIREADKQYREGVGTYALARDHYLFAHQYNGENPALNYKLGVCYLYTDDKYKAIEFFKKAYEQDSLLTKDMHFQLARSYQLVLEFDLAMDHYRHHALTLSKKEAQDYAPLMDKYIQECRHGKYLSREPVRVILRNLGENVNSRFDDYNPVFASGDSALFFTSRRPFAKSKRNPLDNKYNEDIYLSRFKDQQFGPAERLPGPINTERNDAVVGISTEGNTLLIYRGHIDGGEIQGAKYLAKKQKWRKPKRFNSRFASKEGESSACFSPDGMEFYYVSRASKLSQGGKDILVSRKNSRGKWMKPENLGPVINTPWDEEGVFITPDGEKLFFASQGHNSMGGFDIFRSDKKEDGSWSKPVNLGYPINSPDDEIFYVTDQEGRYAYYSATRDGGWGARDIYRLVYLGSEKQLLFKTDEQLLAGPGPVKSGFLTMPESLQLDTSLVVEGRVLFSPEERKPVVAKMEFFEAGTGNRKAFVVSDSSGRFSVHLPDAMVYAIEINSPGYMYFLDILDLSRESGDEKVAKDFFLEKVEVGTKVVLNNIYFETGKAILRPVSHQALDQVQRFLENNPGMKLEISGHTDNTGSLRINQRLSRDRARAVVDYLVERGIAEDMLVYQGYADTQPVATNDTAEGREQNRRVEFKVLSK